MDDLRKLALTTEALHEAGHAVMARLLGLRLGRVWIIRSESSGETCILWPEKPEPQKSLRILAAARACLNAFGVCTSEDQGGFSDEKDIQNIMDVIFPDNFLDDELRREIYISRIDDEVKEFFERPNVRAAAAALAEILCRAGEIDGSRAESVIDQHLRMTARGNNVETGENDV